jgi:hypothetical protein
MLTQFVVSETKPYLFPYVAWCEATLLNITGRAIQLSRAYLRILERIERGGLDEFSVAALDAERTDAHDAFISELQASGIEGVGFDFDARANARELATRIQTWLRED